MADDQQKKPSVNFKLQSTIDIVERLSGGAERRLSWDDIREPINLITDIFPFVGGSFLDGSSFIRGRKLTGGQHFSSTDQLLARKATDVTTYGRCHRPNQSIVYASTNVETVYSELGLHTGDTVQIIKFQKRDGAKTDFTIAGVIDHLRRHGSTSVPNASENTTVLKEYLESLSELDRLRLHITDAFIADHFRKVSKHSFEYKITSAFSDIVFSQGFNALLYPSVGHLGGWNIAIDGKKFEELFEPVASEVFKIYEASDYGIFGALSLKQSQNISDKTIEWHDNVSAPKSFIGYDEFIRYALSFPKPSVLVFQAVKAVEPDDIPEEIKKSAPQHDNAQTVISQVVHTGQHGLSPNSTFDDIKDHLDASVENWDFVTFQIVHSINSPDDIENVAMNLNNHTHTSEHLKFTFSEDGTGLPVISTGAVLPSQPSPD